jgi:hypothetical protein
VSDAEDGWPLHEWIALPRLPETKFAVIPLRSLGFPTDVSPLHLDDALNVLGHRDADFQVWLSASQTMIEPPLKPVFAFQHNRPSDFPYLNFGRYLFPLLQNYFWSISSGQSRALSRSGYIAGIVPDEFGGMVAATWKVDGQVLSKVTHPDTTLASLGITVNSHGVVAGWKNVFVDGITHNGGALWGAGAWIGASPLGINEALSTLTGQLTLPVEINDHGDILANILDAEYLTSLSVDWTIPNWQDIPLIGEVAIFDHNGRHDLGTGVAVAINHVSPAMAVGAGWWAYNRNGDWIRESVLLWDRKNLMSVSPASALLALNDRHELITSSHIIRNGELYLISDYIDSGWSVAALDINNHGVILANAVRTHDDQGVPINNPQSEAVLLIPSALQVDANHDGTIATNETLPTPSNPFRCWSNDDDDDPVLDVGMDYTDTHVNGVEDLKDFFPVFLDITQLLNVLPHTSGAVYKLKHEDGALNFVYTSLTRQTAFQYRTDGDDSTGYGAGGSLPAAIAPTIQIPAEGIPLAAHFLDRMKDQNQGVILVEMRNNSHRPADNLVSGRVSKPLQLIVEKGGVVIAEISLPLKSIEIAVRKKGETVPDHGVLVKTGDIIEVALDEDYFAKPNEQQSRFTWQLRQRKANGTFDEWADFGAHGKGTRFEHTTGTGGVFQIRALFNGTDEVVYKRKKGERLDLFRIYGPAKKSDPESIGICDTEIQIAICRQAQTFYGSTTYAGENPLPAQYGFPAFGTSNNSIIRCNIFVAHQATAAGAVVPAINGYFNEYPPLANEWAGLEDTSIWPGDPTFIEGWPILASDTRPQPGWIIGHPKPGDAGHCAITDYDGEGIGAGTSGTVNKRYEPFWDGTSRLRRYEQ